MCPVPRGHREDFRSCGEFLLHPSGNLVRTCWAVCPSWHDSESWRSWSAEWCSGRPSQDLWWWTATERHSALKYLKGNPWRRGLCILRIFLLSSFLPRPWVFIASDVPLCLGESRRMLVEQGMLLEAVECFFLPLFLLHLRYRRCSSRPLIVVWFCFEVWPSGACLIHCKWRNLQRNSWNCCYLVMMPMLRHILIVGLTSNLCYWHKVYNCGKKRNSF